ncbi:hypothetical protein [Streptomyces scabiei]|uniref:hypothetical protein n=1 Tax=Streptomyces scabiei TaxID=1930 RepID=UPI00076589E0|nr:hypothetical protein [Streptomyces scabiei]
MDLWDVLSLIGVVVLGAGLWLIAPWLALTVGGGALVLVGVGGSVIAERAAARQQLLDAKKGG